MLSVQVKFRTFGIKVLQLYLGSICQSLILAVLFNLDFLTDDLVSW